MTCARPDEQYDFRYWGLQRYGDRHFLSWHTVDINHARLGRVEITASEFRDAQNGRVKHHLLIRKYDTMALKDGLENPSLGVKVFLVASLMLIIAVAVAYLAGWL